MAMEFCCVTHIHIRMNGTHTQSYRNMMVWLCSSIVFYSILYINVLVWLHVCVHRCSMCDYSNSQTLKSSSVRLRWRWEIVKCHRMPTHWADQITVSAPNVLSCFRWQNWKDILRDMESEKLCAGDKTIDNGSHFWKKKKIYIKRGVEKKKKKTCASMHRGYT